MNLFKLLFPGKYKRYLESEDIENNLRDRIHELNKDNKSWQEKYFAASSLDRPVRMADLMRENLKLIRMDFANVPDNGVAPPNPFDIKDKSERENFLAALNQVFLSQPFQTVCKWLIDVQGNFSMRQAENERQVDAGRFSINGISMVMGQMKKAHNMYEESIKPPEKFDKHEIISDNTDEN